MAGSWVFDATDRDFETSVLERSKEVPVLVDLWAPWCGPCRTLGPLLERLAEENRGAFEVAKVNVDENPGLAEAFRVQSIPMVLAFRDGQVAEHFVGALPESELRRFVARLLPSEADRLAADGEQRLAGGDAEGAEAAFRAALEKDVRHGGALVGLASVLERRGDTDEALALLDRVDPGPHRQRADRLAAAIRVQLAGAGEFDELRRRTEANPDDLEALFAYAQAAAARERHEEALAAFLRIVGRDREFRDDAARRAMLDLFALLGNDHPLTDRYRSELAKVLFR